MAARLQLQLQGDATNFAFDVEGEYFPSMEPEWKTSANPPEVTQIREVWEFRDCRIVPADGTTATLWDDYLALKARLETRGSAYPTYARLVRDPAGSATVELTLGPSTYEQFRIELLEGGLDPLNPDASWNTTATLTIRVSAVQKFTDSNGIVGWDQRVSVSYDPAGLRTLRWTTRITTKEGTSAVTKAQSYAVIPTSALGTDHSYSTNGADGIDYVYTDADEQNARTPTVCEAVSEITQWGTVVGVTAAAGSPGSYAYTITTTTTGQEVVERTFASAQGPNASSWVASKAPGAYDTKEVIDEKARRFYAATWTRRYEVSVAPAVRDLITVTLTGGGRAQRLRAVTGGYQARRSVGGFSWWTATVQVLTKKTGQTDFDLPGLPGTPWVLDTLRSTETEAYVDGESASTIAQTRFARQATLVLTSIEKPPGGVAEAMRNAPRVPSYLVA